MSISLYNFIFWYLQWVRLFMHILHQYIFSLSFFCVPLFQRFPNVSIASFSVGSDWIYSHIFNFSTIQPKGSFENNFRSTNFIPIKVAHTPMFNTYLWNFSRNSNHIRNKTTSNKIFKAMNDHDMPI